ncbi:hypothetical protein DOY81_012706 [Sarcophaga bullata]|nr:hypothetical protein DOY81_012706 [Sarcophaga bullata]
MFSTSFSELNVMATHFRVALEPVNLPKCQTDACVQVSVEPTGEHVITTLGEVHVEKCVHDLEKLC